MLRFIRTAAGYESDCGRYRLNSTGAVGTCKLYTAMRINDGEPRPVCIPGNVTLRQAKKDANAHAEKDSTPDAPPESAIPTPRMTRDSYEVWYYTVFGILGPDNWRCHCTRATHEAAMVEAAKFSKYPTRIIKATRELLPEVQK